MPVDDFHLNMEAPSGTNATNLKGGLKWQK